VLFAVFGLARVCLGAPQDARLSESAAALREFAALLAKRHSYTIAPGRGDEIKARVEAFLTKTPQPTRAQAADEMVRVLGTTIDGHAGIESAWLPRARRWMPMLLCPLGDEPGTGIVGVRPDRSGFLDADRPFVVAIGGVDIEEIVRGMDEVLPDGSPALVRHRACRGLRDPARAGVPIDAASVHISVAPAPGSPKSAWREFEMPLAPREPKFGEWPRHASGVRAEGRVGYLRLASMESGDAFLDELRATMRIFDACDGLIIDVRGNGGGRRDALLLLASLVMPPSQAPIAYNAARPLRLGDDDARIDRRMSSRFLTRASAETPEGRALIDRTFAANPHVQFDADAFAPWYVGVLKPAAEGTWWRPDRRVIVLMDEVCFSATDIFLMAMKEIDGVTLMGRPSGGGSGMARTHELASGSVRVSLSSMVSAGPDGGLVDGRGVSPDVLIYPIATDLVFGGTDRVLDASLQELSHPAP